MATLVFTLEDGESMIHSLEPGTTTLGRHPDSIIVLDCPSVSGHHAIIELQDDGCLVIDQQSSNGTRVNGATVEEARLKEGDRVAFGDIQAVFYAGEAPPVGAAPAAAPAPAFIPKPEVTRDAPHLLLQRTIVELAHHPPSHGLCAGSPATLTRVKAAV